MRLEAFADIRLSSVVRDPFTVSDPAYSMFRVVFARLNGFPTDGAISHGVSEAEFPRWLRNSHANSSNSWILGIGSQASY